MITILPSWLPSEIWENYLKYRTQRAAEKAEMTDRAQRMALTKLNNLRKQGNDPVDVIHQTIDNNWDGLFPLKTLPPLELIDRGAI